MLKDDKLVGACLYGDTVDGSWYFKLLREGKNIAAIRDSLMFGESNTGDVGHEGHTKQQPCRTMPRSAVAMACAKAALSKPSKRKVCSRSMMCANTPKLRHRAALCTGLVEQIIMFTAGGDYSATPKQKAMCGCTDYSHAAVRTAIKEQHLITIEQVQTTLHGAPPMVVRAAVPP